MDEMASRPGGGRRARLEITLTIDRPKLTPEDEQKLMQATCNNKLSA